MSATWPIQRADRLIDLWVVLNRVNHQQRRSASGLLGSARACTHTHILRTRPRFGPLGCCSASLCCFALPNFPVCVRSLRLGSSSFGWLVPFPCWLTPSTTSTSIYSAASSRDSLPAIIASASSISYDRCLDSRLAFGARFHTRRHQNQHRHRQQRDVTHFCREPMTR